MPIVAKKSIRPTSQTIMTTPAAQLEVNPRPRTRMPADTPQPPTSNPGAVSSAPAAAATAEGSAKPAVPLNGGYRNPPKHSQFKPGQSGNPKGRPKGAKGLKTIVREVLNEKVTIKNGGGSKRVTKIVAAVHKMMERAFSGDVRALNLLVQFYANAVPDEPVLKAVEAVERQSRDEIDEHDRIMLEALQSMRDVGGEDDE